MIGVFTTCSDQPRGMVVRGSSRMSAGSVCGETPPRHVARVMVRRSFVQQRSPGSIQCHHGIGRKGAPTLPASSRQQMERQHPRCRQPTLSAAASAAVPNTRQTMRLTPGARSSTASRCSIGLISGFPCSAPASSALTGTDPFSLMKADPADAREFVIGYAGKQSLVRRRAASALR